MELAQVQQQLLQRLVTSNEGTGNQTVGLGLCKIALRDDSSAFLLTFEKMVTSPGWNKGAWALRLALYLSGENQAAYMALSEHQAKYYDTLKATILGRVGPVGGEVQPAIFGTVGYVPGLLHINCQIGPFGG